MIQSNSPFAVVTGVTDRIGFALAERCAGHGFDLIVASPVREVAAAAERLRDHGVSVEAVRLDLDAADDIEELCDIARVLGRPIDALVAAPGMAAIGGRGAGFLDQDFEEAADALELGALGVMRLAHRIGRDMRDRGRGRILIAGAPAVTPGAAGAVTCAANALLSSFAVSLRQELGEHGVSVTFLSPRPRRWVVQAACARVLAAQDARQGFEAMMRGELGLSEAEASAVAVASGRERERPPQAPIPQEDRALKH
jgi:short-subunit dehydrogenase